MNDNKAAIARVRERQWIYLGPILAAPVAHICVSLYQLAKTTRQKQLVAAGIVGSTLGTLAMRGILMIHAGYPGGPNSKMSQRELVVTSIDEKAEIEKPSNTEILRQAFCGFG